ncbi:MAG TPA: isoprenylcysteine carboxylmethyltransferase family protein [Vicinamibacterales bacterium]|nr:isoprenylcysteine carboxylmethyltransferase family protein [Vicinamibacterales bacterium]
MTSRARSRLGVCLVGGAFFALFFHWRPERIVLFAEGWPAGPRVVAMVAVICAIAGILFSLWAINTLGKQWSFSARVIEGHQLVTHGPYAIVRNPIYASMALWLVALALTFATPARLAIALSLYVVGTLMRVRAEEELMRATFGEQWEDYRRRVPALIPWL